MSIQKNDRKKSKKDVFTFMFTKKCSNKKFYFNFLNLPKKFFKVLQFFVYLFSKQMNFFGIFFLSFNILKLCDFFDMFVCLFSFIF